MALRIRNGAIAGIVGAIVTVVAGLITGAPPSPDDPVAEFRDFMIDKRSTIRWQFVLFALGLILIVWFFAAFSTLMSRGETPTAFTLLPVIGTMGLMGVAFGGGASYAAVVWRGPAGFDHSELQAAYDANNLAGAFLSIAAVVIMLAAAALIMRSALLPKWLAWFAVVAAVVNAISVLGVLFDPDQTALAPGGAFTIIGLVVTMAWILTAGVLMYNADSA
jgi:hypothetical protein